MPKRYIARLDLNLLVALDALLVEHNVSRAALRVGMTQPAMSRALGRLRDALGDPLLVRTGRGMRPTPRASALAASLHRLLGELDAAVGASPAFDPALARRRFRVATADYGVAVVIPPLLERLARIAPGVGVVVRNVTAELGAQLEAGEIDVVVAPRQPLPAGVVWRTLFGERFVCVARRGHPRLRGRLTLDRFCELGHVVVAPRGRDGNPIDERLARRGRSRHVALEVPTFLSAPLAVAGSDLITTAPERIARRFEAPLALAIHAPPLEVAGFTVALGWHERVRADAGHAWFRGVVGEIGLALRASLTS